MGQPVCPNTSRLDLVNTLAATGAPLAGVTHRLSSANVIPTVQTKLADLVECVFTGYMPVPGLDPGDAYIGPDTAVHASYPSQLFQATDGAAQVIGTQAAGTISMGGNITAIITAAGMTGSPVTLTVAVVTTDTPQDIAQKIATAIRANADVSAKFDVAVNGGGVFYLTRKAAAANDATMNIALADGTAVGLTAAPTASQLRAGVVAGGAYTAETAYVQFATDATGTELLFAQQLNSPVSFAVVGAGAELELDYPYGA